MMEVPGLKIAGPLGKGGTAQVAQAFSSELKKDVAAKYPLLDDPASIAQFSQLARREHQLIGNLKFPGFVNVLKHSENPSYLLLELCRGQSLDKLGKVDDTQMLLVIICAVAADLEFIRINNLVHGDLKPHNVFLPFDFPLYENGDLFFAKISDFSLGRFLDEPESARAGHGTVGYAAPETSKDGKTSHQSDLFALGVIAYQLATGQHPFIVDETDPVKIQSRIQEDEPVPLTVFRNNLPGQFIELVNTLLAKDEKDRPEKAWSVCETLAECGCNYPYEKIVSPSFLIKSRNNYDQFAEQFLELSEKQKKQLTAYTGSNLGFLRIVLSANFAGGNLFYNGQKFALKSNVYWPSFLRRKSLTFFAQSAVAGKKEIIRAALTGNIDTAKDAPPGTAILFSHLLSASYLKNHSTKFAIQSESTGDFTAAAKLYLQAGQFEKALACAEKATANLIAADRRAEGVHLINRVLELAQMTGREFDSRHLLMVKGDIERTGGDTDSASKSYTRIVELYQGKQPDKLLAETYRDLGDIYKTRQRFDEGIKVLNQALSICRELKDDLLTSRTLNNIGELYRIATDLNNSLKFVRQALAIQKRLGAVSDAASSINSMAIIYGTKGKLKRALTLLTISLKMKRTLGDQFEIARTLNNLGYAHQLSGDSEKAQIYLKESLAINRQMRNKSEELHNLWNLSEIMMKSGSLKEALNYVKEGLDIAVTLNLKPHQAHFLRSMGYIYHKMNRFTESENCYNQTSRLVNEIDDRILKIRLLLSQSELAFELGDPKTAVSLSEQARLDSIAIKAGLEEFQSLLILVKILGKSEHLNRAKTLVQELKLHRENVLIEFSYFHYLLEIDATNDLKRLYKPLELQLEGMRDDIEYPKLLNIAGEILIISGDKKGALILLSQSLQLARSKNLITDEIGAHILIGRISFAESDYGKAYGNYRAALQLCKQAAISIVSDDAKMSFMKKPKMIFLANEIRRLNEKIGIKQKAGV